MTRNEFINQLKAKYHVKDIFYGYISVSLEPETTVYVTLYKTQCKVYVSSWDDGNILSKIGLSYQEAFILIESTLKLETKMNKETFCKKLFSTYHVEIIEEDYISVSICPNRILYVTLGDYEVVGLEIAVHLLGYWQEESYDEMTFEDALWIIKNTLRYGA